MRGARTRRLTSLGVSALACAALWSGCSGKKQTEVVLGVNTQMRVPEDIQTIQLIVNGGGTIVFDQEYSVYDGVVRLPQTLGLVPSGGDFVVDVTVLGYSLPRTSAIFDTDPPPSNSSTQILRHTVTQYIDQEILYLPMQLRYPCYQVSCADGQTCTAGECVPDAVDPASLTLYAPDKVFGNTSSCFDVTSCFLGAEPPVVVDPTSCTFALPGTASAGDAGGGALPPAQGSGLNVRVGYEKLETEVLDLDPVEGFFIPDPSKPQEFRLAPGLCQLYLGTNPHNPHIIVSLGASGACPPKGIDQPLCAGDPANNNLLPDGGNPSFDYVELTPVRTELYLLMDASSDMSTSFGPNGAQQILSFSLEDPVLQSVVMAFGFFPTATSCQTPFPPPVVPPSSSGITFESPLAAQPGIAAQFDQMDGGVYGPPAVPPLGADLALAAAVSTVASTTSNPSDRQAVVVISGNDPGSGTCGPAGLAALPAGVLGYYVNAPVGDAGAVSQAVVTELTHAGFAYLDATTPAKALNAFNQIVAELGSCEYGMPAPVIPSSASLAYLDPFTEHLVPIAPLPSGMSCTGASAGSGWEAETAATGAIIRVCGQACTTMQQAIEARSALAEAAHLTAAPTFPVYAELPLPGDE
jgi:hypothetical protein